MCYPVILIIILCFSGKTTILYKIKLNENLSTIPTIGFNVETVEPIKGISFTVWDVGGHDKVRRDWEQYYRNTDGELRKGILNVTFFCEHIIHERHFKIETVM